MPRILTKKFTHPLEREYEAWIVRGIEDYFRELGRPATIWAVSPDVEATWPADEQLVAGGKLFGLQFKQAKMARGPISFSRLKWSLAQPPNQMATVDSFPEIFYCLPTFINREYSRRALDHCLFWRPEGVLDPNVWYDNPAAQTPHKKVRGAMRWGMFIETAYSCSIGKKVESGADLLAFVQKIRDSMVHPKRQRPRADESEEAGAREERAVIYLFLITLPN